MDNSSGVGVLDKAATVLGALEAGPATLAQLVAATHLARPTAHRLAVALEFHRFVTRDMQGRFILGPRLAELAASAGEDDIVQEVFIKLWEVRNRLEPKRSLISYLYKMTKNQSLNYLRDRVNDETSLDELSPKALKMDDKWSNEIQNESGDDVKMLALIADLPNRQREAIKLSRFEGLTHDEIAYVMQISPSTVNNHIVAALKSLKQAWQAQDDQQKRGLNYEG